jgi:hypothetical protein
MAWRAHRASWVLHGKELPAPPLELDHTCHNPETCKGGITCPHRACFNPEHCNPATRRQNTSPSRSCSSTVAAVAAHRAITHCPSGHAYDAKNTLFYRERRYCRTCQNIRSAARSISSRERPA